MTNSLLAIVVVLASLLVFGAAPAHADGVVKTDVVVQLKNSLFNAPEFALTSLLKGHEVAPVPDMVVADRVPIHLSGISVEADWQLETPATSLALGVDFPLASKALDVRMMIRKLEVDAWVDQEVGGVIVRAHVLGHCENIPLSVSSGASLSGVVRTGVDTAGLPTVQLVSVRADWTESAWQIGEFSCGLGGESFRAKVHTGLKSYLAAPSVELNARLKEILATRLESYQSRLREWFLAPRSMKSGIKGLSLTLRPRAIQRVLDDGLLVGGQMDFSFASRVEAAPVEVKASETAPVLSQNGFELAFPHELLPALSEMADRLGYLRLRQRGWEIPAFRDFLGNPLFKFFLWPQLMFYSERDPFYFDFALTARPRLESIANAETGGVSGKIAAPLGVLIWAPVKNADSSTGFVKMMRFAAPLETTYRWTIKPAASGGSDFQISFAQTALSLRADWEPDYRSRLFNPLVAVDVLKDHLVSWVEARSLQFHLPPLQLTSGLALSFSEVRRQGDWLSFKLVDECSGRGCVPQVRSSSSTTMPNHAPGRWPWPF